MIRNLGKQNSIINQYVCELRHIEIQKDSWRFRKNLERISSLMAYEISKEMKFESQLVVTPLGELDVPVLKEKPVIASILRSGIPMQNGMLEIFDKAENAFVAAYRKYQKEDDFFIRLEYVTCPDLEDKTLIIVDPMLATGSSILQVWQELQKYGKPAHTHFVSVLASEEGLTYIKRNIPEEDISIWVAAIDQELTVRSYIVPGLGDAGDLAFGAKLQGEI